MNKIYEDSSFDSLFDELDQDVYQAESPTFPSIKSLILAGARREQDLGNASRARMPGFHPSFISGRRCVKAYGLHYMKEKSIGFQPKTLMVMDNGTDVHTRLQRYLKPNLYGTWKCRSCKTFLYPQKDYVDWISETEHKDHYKYYKPSNTPRPMPKKCPVCGEKDQRAIRYAEWKIVDSKLGLSGEIDGIIKNGNGEFVGLEIKSARSTSLPTMLSGKGYMAKYIEQFCIYLKSLGLEYGMIIFEEKDSQEIYEYPVRVSEQSHVDEIFSLMEQARKYVDSGEIEHLSMKAIKECLSCPYYNDECEPT